MLSDDLPVPVILGTNYQDSNVLRIGPMHQDVELRDRSRLTLRRRVSSSVLERRPAPPMVSCTRSAFITHKKNHVKLGRGTVLPANSQTFVKMTARRSGVMFAE